MRRRKRAQRAKTWAAYILVAIAALAVMSLAIEGAEYASVHDVTG